MVRLFDLRDFAGRAACGKATKDDLLALPTEMLRQYEESQRQGGPSIATVRRLQMAIALYAEIHATPQASESATLKLRALANAMLPFPEKWTKAEYNAPANENVAETLREQIAFFVQT